MIDAYSVMDRRYSGGRERSTRADLPVEWRSLVEKVRDSGSYRKKLKFNVVNVQNSTHPWCMIPMMQVYSCADQQSSLSMHAALALSDGLWMDNLDRT